MLVLTNLRNGNVEHALLLYGEDGRGVADGAVDLRVQHCCIAPAIISIIAKY